MPTMTQAGSPSACPLAATVQRRFPKASRCNRAQAAKHMATETKSLQLRTQQESKPAWLTPNLESERSGSETLAGLRVFDGDSQTSLEEDLPLELLTVPGLSLLLFERERRCELDRVMQCAIEWAAHGVEAVHAFHGPAVLFLRRQPHGHVDAAYREHTFLGFYLAGHFPNELPVARIDVTRLQRASEGAEHSTSGRSNHVVDRGGVRLPEFRGIDFVVLGYRPVDAEDYLL